MEVSSLRSIERGTGVDVNGERILFIQKMVTRRACLQEHAVLPFDYKGSKMEAYSNYQFYHEPAQEQSCLLYL